MRDSVLWMDGLDERILELIDVIRRKAERTDSEMIESELQLVTNERGNLDRTDR